MATTANVALSDARVSLQTIHDLVEVLADSMGNHDPVEKLGLHLTLMAQVRDDVRRVFRDVRRAERVSARARASAQEHERTPALPRSLPAV